MVDVHLDESSPSPHGFREPKIISLKEFETIFKLVDVPAAGTRASDT